MEEENKQNNEAQKNEMDAIIEKIKEAVKQGNANKLVVKKDEKEILSVPVNIGIIGVVALPWTFIASVVAAYGFNCKFEVHKDDGSIDYIN